MKQEVNPHEQAAQWILSGGLIEITGVLEPWIFEAALERLSNKQLSADGENNYNFKY